MARADGDDASALPSSESGARAYGRRSSRAPRRASDSQAASTLAGGGRSGKGKADGSRTPSALTRRTTSTTGRRSSSGFSDASNVSA